MKRIIISTLVMLSVLILSTCKKEIKIEEIILYNKEIRLSIGESVELVATVIPDDATQPLVIDNSNPKVANFLGGMLWGLSPGETTITFRTEYGTKSATCIVIVGLAPSAIITINTHPQAITDVTFGSITGTLNVSASVTQGAKLSYQWYSNTTNNNTGGTAILGATNASFMIPTTLALGTHYYFCEVNATSEATSVRSNVARVNVSSPTVPIITINTHPQATTNVTAGSITGSLNVNASVTLGATLSYQWYASTSLSTSGGTVISGATGANFSIPTTLTAGTYYYFCEVRATGGATSVRSNVARVNVAANVTAWTQKADFARRLRVGAVGFSIGNKGYVGTGHDGSSYNRDRDFWEYDPVSNVWTQKANFAGVARASAVGFSIGNKGYVGTGEDGSVRPYRQDFWEYDPVSNVWTQKANFAGGARDRAVGFSIGNKGYVGTGWDGSNLRQDFWEYDPVSNVWTQKANFAGGARSAAVGFSIGNKGYVGSGGNVTFRQDFWEYDPVSNVWTQKANFAGVARIQAVGFSIGNKGYVGTGWNGISRFQDFWEYDPISNVWTQKANFAGGARYEAVGFSIGNKGYVGTGVGAVFFQDFWEFSP